MKHLKIESRFFAAVLLFKSFEKVDEVEVFDSWDSESSSHNDSFSCPLKEESRGLSILKFQILLGLDQS